MRTKQLTEIKRVVVTNTLRGCQLLSGVPAGDVEAIAAFAVVKHLAKGDYLFREGSIAEGFYVMQQGGIKVHRVNLAGKEQVIHVFRTGESFAEAALGSEVGYPADAQAIERSTVLLIPKRDILDLLRRRPDLALKMLGSLSQHLRVLVGLLDDLTLKDVETRLANWLLVRCPKPLRQSPTAIKLDRTKRVLAAELGTASETLSRTLAKFRDRKLVDVHGQTIIVTHPLKLEALLLRPLGEWPL